MKREGHDMEYTVNKLAKMSGVSTRTLRYYDEIDLLKPEKIRSNGYRVYGIKQVDILQQILFYRELGFCLEDIKKIIKSENFNKKDALEKHLEALIKRKEQIETLIVNVSKSIGYAKGAIVMDDKEKFEGFKQRLIEKNEEEFGKETRKLYGDDVVDKSNEKMKKMNKQQMEYAQKLSAEINEALQEAVKINDPSSEIAQRACKLHKEWICMYWPDDLYCPENHIALVEGYLEDERFMKYYERIAQGCTEFLNRAINIYYAG